jgi:hypothetical protein
MGIEGHQRAVGSAVARHVVEVAAFSCGFMRKMEGKSHATVACKNWGDALQSDPGGGFSLPPVAHMPCLFACRLGFGLYGAAWAAVSIQSSLVVLLLGYLVFR